MTLESAPKAETPRWFVYIGSHAIPEDVGADLCRIEQGGVLAFYSLREGKEMLLLAYAPGVWRMVDDQ